MLKYFKREKNTDYVLKWKSNGITDEVFKVPRTDNILKPSLAYCTYNYEKNSNIYTVYEIISYYSWSNDHTLENCLFVAVNLTENADIDKYKNSGGTDRNVTVFGLDMSSSTKIHNRKKYILIFW